MLVRIVIVRLYIAVSLKLPGKNKNNTSNKFDKDNIIRRMAKIA